MGASFRLGFVLAIFIGGPSALAKPAVKSATKGSAKIKPLKKPKFGSAIVSDTRIVFAVTKRHDLDGDGTPDAVAVGCVRLKDSCTPGKAFVSINGAESYLPLEVKHSFFDVPFNQYAWKFDKRYAQVVGLGKKRKGVLVRQYCQDEGCDDMFTLVVKNGKKAEQVWQKYTARPPTFRKDGSWLAEEGHRCLKPGRSNGDGKIVKWGKESYTVNRYRYRKGKVSVVGKGRLKTRKSDCGAYGRCPYVYAGTDESLVGEILTNYIGKAASRAQRLAIPRRHVKAGVLRIRIAEEKPDETTFIDDVWLEVNGQRLSPKRCAAPLCGKDGRFYRLPLGKSIILEFENVPAQGRLYLGASGYYDLH